MVDGRLTISIQPDARYRGRKAGSFSDRWALRAESLGVDVRPVDVYAPDIVEQIRGSDGFMWRYMNRLRERRLGQTLLPSVELGLGIPVYPSWTTGRYYEDKVAQKYALEAAGIPTPATWVFYDRREVDVFLRSAKYPLVLKLASGIMSKNVTLIHDAAEGTYWARRLFGTGTTDLDRPRSWHADAWRRVVEASRVARGLPFHHRVLWGGTEQGYLYFQEFVPGNAFDTRVTVVGRRAWAFRRFNRPGDFRSSGSGLIDYDTDAIDGRAVRLAFVVAERLQTQSLTVDALYRGDEIVLNEISYSYQSEGVRACPGHWVLDGTPADGPLRWVEGASYSEDAIFDDFVAHVRTWAAGAPEGCHPARKYRPVP